MRPPASDVDYWELHGAIEPGVRRRPTSNAVVLSNLLKGQHSAPGAEGVCIRFVARGREDYRIGGRWCRLEAGQVMIAPHAGGADCEIQPVEQSGTLGVCTLIRGRHEALDWVQGPLVLSPRQTPLASMMSNTASQLVASQRPKLGLAQDLIAGLAAQLPGIGRSLLGQLASVDGAKISTRFEMVRRANLARAYLDATVNRAVELAEVATEVGVSPFRLLAAFQQCFHETPASYHRKLRLGLALEEARRRQAPIELIANEFGFASGSSLSHAYRRAFGRAPVWSKCEAA